MKLNDWQFAQRKYLPYETKLRLTETRIREWHYNWAGQVYLSYSGGLDSTVLLHMIRKELGNDVPAVFSNTGLEFPEIVRFARKASGAFEEIYPRDKNGKRITFKQIVNQYGFPLVSKETAAKIEKLRHGKLSERYRNYLLNGDERGKFGMLPKKWRFLLDVEFDTSQKCCDKMKKKPFKEYEKRTGKERKFTSGMNRRYKLIFSNPVSGMKEDDWVKLHYHFTPNIPSNVLEESQIAGNLDGIVSQETQLGVLSVVDNVQNEMEKIESEQEKAKTDPVMTQMFGGAGDGKPGVLEEPGNGSKET